MRLTVRIYKRHDPDLLALYFASGEEYNIKIKIKEAVREYISGQKVINSIPDLECPSFIDLPPKINFHIPLKKDEDKDIIEWLNTIKKGRRNNLIKNIFRNTFPPIIAPYYPESETDSFKINENRGKDND